MIHMLLHTQFQPQRSFLLSSIPQGALSPSTYPSTFPPLVLRVSLLKNCHNFRWSLLNFLNYKKMLQYTSKKHQNRTALLDFFSSEHEFHEVAFHHSTYHHFVGLGNSDSDLDHILYSSKLQYQEILQDIYCKLSEPLIDSHHDMIISSWSLPDVTTEAISSDNVKAPRVENNRHKVI